MNILLLKGIAGAKQARGLTVIIDVFRAFTVEAYLANANAARIIPVEKVETAFDYKEKHPDTTVLCGERDGIMIDGFDFGNSPSQIEGHDFSGKTIIHTTSAGTQGIANAVNADEIIGGSLVAAQAIANYIKKRNPAEVSLVCMGLAGKTETDEDNLCGEYIKSLLEGTPLDKMDERMSAIQYTSGAKFFDPQRQHIFPERDFHLCLKLNTIPFILHLKADEENCLSYMERIEVL